MRRVGARELWSMMTPSCWSGWACRSRSSAASTATSRSPPPRTSPSSRRTSRRWPPGLPGPAEHVVPEGRGEPGPSMSRVGLGYDIHRLVVGRALVLAGVTLPWDLGLEGHSDGDAICHAVADALLGAAGLGDIGQYFPSDDEKWR